MLIAASSVQFQSSRVAMERHELRESLRVWREPPAPPAPEPAPPPVTPKCEGGGKSEEGSPICAEDFELTLIRLLVERLTGRKLQLFDPAALRHPPAVTVTPEPAPSESAPPSDTPAPDFGLIYERSETHYEMEAVEFSAKALVKTTDGKEIAVTVDLAMSREMLSTSSESLRAGAAALKDPLILNFNGTAAQLTKTHFDFDLTADGAMEQVAVATGGSAFLALDSNHNGAVDDGSELFGTRTGDGFAELARLDADKNGWIDEADPTFTQLRLWWKDEDGTDHLTTLAERNVGAIHLGSVATPYSITNAENGLEGMIRSTGVFLNEDGSAGTVQQVDLVV